MKGSIWVLSAVIFLAVLGSPPGRAALFLSQEGGDWHSPSTWREGKVPSGDNDTFTIYAQAPLSLAKGSVSAANLYLYPITRPGSLTIAPLAHMNILKYFATQRNLRFPIDITVEGSLALQGGALFYGNVSFNIRGGYVSGIGRAWSFTSEGKSGNVVTVSDGGMLSVRQLFIGRACVITIDKGEARFETLSFSGGGEIHVDDGILVVYQIEGAESGKIILGDNGQLLLKGTLDVTTLPQTFPGLSVSDKKGKRSLDSLAFSPGTGNFSGYTRIRLSAPAAGKETFQK